MAVLFVVKGANVKKYILLMPIVLGSIVFGSIGWWQTARSKPLNPSLSQESPVERLNARAQASKDDGMHRSNL